VSREKADAARYQFLMRSDYPTCMRLLQYREPDCSRQIDLLIAAEEAAAVARMDERYARADAEVAPDWDAGQRQAMAGLAD
jgi:hypothetical protein